MDTLKDVEKTVEKPYQLKKRWVSKMKYVHAATGQQLTEAYAGLTTSVSFITATQTHLLNAIDSAQQNMPLYDAFIYYKQLVEA